MVISDPAACSELLETMLVVDVSDRLALTVLSGDAAMVSVPVTLKTLVVDDTVSVELL